MNPPPLPKLALLICDVFEQELALVSAGADHVVARRVFEMGLHDHPDRMRVALQQAVSELEAAGDVEMIALVYGLCGCGTAGLHPGRATLVIPRAHDCRAVFLGSKEEFARREKACPGCYYYTPGWNRARRVPGPERTAMLRADYLAKYDPEDVEYLLETDRELWQSYHKAAFIDHGTEAGEREAAYTRECAASLGWEFEHIQGDRRLLHDLVWGPWDAERFQLILPGQRLAHSPDESIMRAEPDKS